VANPFFLSFHVQVSFLLEPSPHTRAKKKSCVTAATARSSFWFFSGMRGVIKFGATNLPRKDLGGLGKSDAVVVLFKKNLYGGNKYVVVGETETIPNESSPRWETPIPIDFEINDPQLLKVAIYDSDGDEKRELIHEFSDLSFRDMIQKGGKIELAFNKKSLLTMEYFTISCNSDILDATIRCKIPRKKGILRPDPYVTIAVPAEGKNPEDHKSHLQIFSLRDQTRKDKTEAEWKIKGDVGSLAGGSIHRKVIFYVWDYEKSNKDICLASCTITWATVLEELKKEKDGKYTLPWVPIKGGENPKWGTLTFSNVVLTRVRSVADLLKDAQDPLIIVGKIGVDFTGSNGDMSSPTSLHYKGSLTTPYYEAIEGIVNIMGPYDSDGTLDISGFGACPSSSEKVSDYFLLPSSTEEKGASPTLHALSSYVQAQHNVELGDRTLFAPTLEKWITEAWKVEQARKQGQKGKKYIIGILLTDGECDDLEECQQLLVAHEHFPFSVIFVGVGTSDFKRLQSLVATNQQPLKTKAGLTASRRMTTFVSYQEARKDGPFLLAKNLLASTTDQIEKFYVNCK
jgi:hypothetical protein